MIVLTCASGKQASSIIPHLVSNDTSPIRLLVNSASSERNLKSQYPSAEVIRANLSSSTECQSVLHGATTIFLILPPFHHAEDAIGKNMIDAAVIESSRPGNTLKHFIFSSVIQTQLRKMLHHDVKRYVEEYLMESGLKYTILKPTTFFDNFGPAIENMVKEAGTGKTDLQFAAPWNPDVAFSELSLQDYGYASFRVISEPEKHYYASYDFASTFPEAWRTKIDVLAKVLGCKIEVSAKPTQEVAAGFVKMLGGDKAHRETMDIAERMVLYYNRHGIVGNPGLLEMVMGRKATTTEQWVREQIDGIKHGR